MYLGTACESAFGASLQTYFIIQIPWGQWTVTGHPLVISLCDVHLNLQARESVEWEEEAAIHRDHCAKHAELAAAELAKLSSRLESQRLQRTDKGGNPASTRSGAVWGLSYIIDLLSRFLLSRLQLSISNVNVQFKTPSYQAGCKHNVLGLKLEKLTTAVDLQTLPKSLADIMSSSAGPKSLQSSQASCIMRHLGLEQVQLYWQQSQAGEGENCCRDFKHKDHPEASPTGQGTMLPHQQQAAIIKDRDLLIKPFDCTLRVSMLRPAAAAAAAGPPRQQPQNHDSRHGTCDYGNAAADSSATKQAHHVEADPAVTCLDAALVSQRIHLQISPAQMSGIYALLDDTEIWMKRSRYGRFRPPGWLTAQEARHIHCSPSSSVPSLKVQRMAIEGSPKDDTSPVLPVDMPCSLMTYNYSNGDYHAPVPNRATALWKDVWKDVWKYAIRAVLYDIRMRRHGTNAPMKLRDFGVLRRQYLRLYTHRLVSHFSNHLAATSEAACHSSGAVFPLGHDNRDGNIIKGGVVTSRPRSLSRRVSVEMTRMENEGGMELQKLEADLDVQQILLFRALAEQEVERHSSILAPVSSAGPVQAEASCAGPIQVEDAGKGGSLLCVPQKSMSPLHPPLPSPPLPSPPLVSDTGVTNTFILSQPTSPTSPTTPTTPTTPTKTSPQAACTSRLPAASKTASGASNLLKASLRSDDETAQPESIEASAAMSQAAGVMHSAGKHMPCHALQLQSCTEDYAFLAGQASSDQGPYLDSKQAGSHIVNDGSHVLLESSRSSGSVNISASDSVTALQLQSITTEGGGIPHLKSITTEGRDIPQLQSITTEGKGISQNAAPLKRDHNPSWLSWGIQGMYSFFTSGKPSLMNTTTAVGDEAGSQPSAMSTPLSTLPSPPVQPPSVPSPSDVEALYQLMHYQSDTQPDGVFEDVILQQSTASDVTSADLSSHSSIPAFKQLQSTERECQRSTPNTSGAASLACGPLHSSGSGAGADTSSGINMDQGHGGGGDYVRPLNCQAKEDFRLKVHILEVVFSMKDYALTSSEDTMASDEASPTATVTSVTTKPLAAVKLHGTLTKDSRPDSSKKLRPVAEDGHHQQSPTRAVDDELLLLRLHLSTVGFEVVHLASGDINGDMMVQGMMLKDYCSDPGSSDWIMRDSASSSSACHHESPIASYNVSKGEKVPSSNAENSSIFGSIFAFNRGVANTDTSTDSTELGVTLASSSAQRGPLPSPLASSSAQRGPLPSPLASLSSQRGPLPSPRSHTWRSSLDLGHLESRSREGAHASSHHHAQQPGGSTPVADTCLSYTNPLLVPSGYSSSFLRQNSQHSILVSEPSESDLLSWHAGPTTSSSTSARTRAVASSSRSSCGGGAPSVFNNTTSAPLLRAGGSSHIATHGWAAARSSQSALGAVAAVMSPVSTHPVTSPFLHLSLHLPPSSSTAATAAAAASGSSACRLKQSAGTSRPGSPPSSSHLLAGSVTCSGLVRIKVSPFQLRYHPACFEKVSFAFSPDALDSAVRPAHHHLLMSSCLSLPTRHAQLLAQGQSLGFKPSGQSLRVHMEMEEIVVVVDHPLGSRLLTAHSQPPYLAEKCGVVHTAGTNNPASTSTTSTPQMTRQLNCVELIFKSVSFKSKSQGAESGTGHTASQSHTTLLTLLNMHTSGCNPAAGDPLWSVAMDGSLQQYIQSLTLQAVQEAEEALVYSKYVAEVSSVTLQLLPTHRQHLAVGALFATDASEAGAPGFFEGVVSSPQKRLFPVSPSHPVEEGLESSSSLPLPSLSLKATISKNCMAPFDSMLPHTRMDVEVAILAEGSHSKKIHVVGNCSDNYGTLVASELSALASFFQSVLSSEKHSNQDPRASSAIQPKTQKPSPSYRKATSVASAQLKLSGAENTAGGESVVGGSRSPQLLVGSLKCHPFLISYIHDLPRGGLAEEVGRHAAAIKPLHQQQTISHAGAASSSLGAPLSPNLAITALDLSCPSGCTFNFDLRGSQTSMSTFIPQLQLQHSSADSATAAIQGTLPYPIQHASMEDIQVSFSTSTLSSGSHWEVALRIQAAHVRGFVDDPGCFLEPNRVCKPQGAAPIRKEPLGAGGSVIHHHQPASGLDAGDRATSASGEISPMIALSFRSRCVSKDQGGGTEGQQAADVADALLSSAMNASSFSNCAAQTSGTLSGSLLIDEKPLPPPPLSSSSEHYPHSSATLATSESELQVLVQGMAVGSSLLTAFAQNSSSSSSSKTNSSSPGITSPSAPSAPHAANMGRNDSEGTTLSHYDRGAGRLYHGATTSVVAAAANSGNLPSEEPSTNAAVAAAAAAAEGGKATEISEAMLEILGLQVQVCDCMLVVMSKGVLSHNQDKDQDRPPCHSRDQGRHNVGLGKGRSNNQTGEMMWDSLPSCLGMLTLHRADLVLPHFVVSSAGYEGSTEGWTSGRPILSPSTHQGCSLGSGDLSIFMERPYWQQPDDDPQQLSASGAAAASSDLSGSDRRKEQLPSNQLGSGSNYSRTVPAATACIQDLMLLIEDQVLPGALTPIMYVSTAQLSGMPPHHDNYNGCYSLSSSTGANACKTLFGRPELAGASLALNIGQVHGTVRPEQASIVNHLISVIMMYKHDDGFSDNSTTDPAGTAGTANGAAKTKASAASSTGTESITTDRPATVQEMFAKGRALPPVHVSAAIQSVNFTLLSHSDCMDDEDCYDQELRDEVFIMGTSGQMTTSILEVELLGLSSSCNSSKLTSTGEVPTSGSSILLTGSSNEQSSSSCKEGGLRATWRSANNGRDEKDLAGSCKKQGVQPALTEGSSLPSARSSRSGDTLPSRHCVSSCAASAELSFNTLTVSHTSRHAATSSIRTKMSSSIGTMIVGHASTTAATLQDPCLPARLAAASLLGNNANTTESSPYLPSYQGQRLHGKQLLLETLSLPALWSVISGLIPPSQRSWLSESSTHDLWHYKQRSGTVKDNDAADGRPAVVRASTLDHEQLRPYLSSSNKQQSQMPVYVKSSTSVTAGAAGPSLMLHSSGIIQQATSFMAELADSKPMLTSAASDRKNKSWTVLGLNRADISARQHGISEATAEDVNGGTSADDSVAAALAAAAAAARLRYASGRTTQQPLRLSEQVLKAAEKALASSSALHNIAWVGTPPGIIKPSRSQLGRSRALSIGGAGGGRQRAGSTSGMLPVGKSPPAAGGMALYSSYRATDFGASSGSGALGMQDLTSFPCQATYQNASPLWRGGQTGRDTASGGVVPWLGTGRVVEEEEEEEEEEFFSVVEGGSMDLNGLDDFEDLPSVVDDIGGSWIHEGNMTTKPLSYREGGLEVVITDSNTIAYHYAESSVSPELHGGSVLLAGGGGGQHPPCRSTAAAGPEYTTLQHGNRPSTTADAWSPYHNGINHTGDIISTGHPPRCSLFEPQTDFHKLARRLMPCVLTPTTNNGAGAGANKIVLEDGSACQANRVLLLLVKGVKDGSLVKVSINFHEDDDGPNHCSASATQASATQATATQATATQAPATTQAATTSSNMGTLEVCCQDIVTIVSATQWDPVLDLLWELQEYASGRAEAWLLAQQRDSTAAAGSKVLHAAAQAAQASLQQTTQELEVHLSQQNKARLQSSAVKMPDAMQSYPHGKEAEGPVPLPKSVVSFPHEVSPSLKLMLSMGVTVNVCAGPERLYGSSTAALAAAAASIRHPAPARVHSDASLPDATVAVEGGASRITSIGQSPNNAAFLSMNSPNSTDENVNKDCLSSHFAETSASAWPVVLPCMSLHISLLSQADLCSTDGKVFSVCVDLRSATLQAGSVALLHCQQGVYQHTCVGDVNCEAPRESDEVSEDDEQVHLLRDRIVGTDYDRLDKMRFLHGWQTSVEVEPLIHVQDMKCSMTNARPLIGDQQRKCHGPGCAASAAAPAPAADLQAVVPAVASSLPPDGSTQHDALRLSVGAVKVPDVGEDEGTASAGAECGINGLSMGPSLSTFLTDRPACVASVAGPAGPRSRGPSCSGISAGRDYQQEDVIIAISDLEPASSVWLDMGITNVSLYVGDAAVSAAARFMVVLNSSSEAGLPASAPSPSFHTANQDHQPTSNMFPKGVVTQSVMPEASEIGLTTMVTSPLLDASSGNASGYLPSATSTTNSTSFMGLQIPIVFPPAGLQASLSIQTLAMVWMSSERRQLVLVGTHESRHGARTLEPVFPGSSVPLFEAACQDLHVNLTTSGQAIAPVQQPSLTQQEGSKLKDAAETVSCKHTSVGGQSLQRFKPASLRQTAIDARQSDQLALTLSGTILLDCFNSEKLGWEPVLEPWILKAGLRGAICTSSAVPPTLSHHSSSAMSSNLSSASYLVMPEIDISATGQAELTVSPSLFSCVTAGNRMAEEIKAEARAFALAPPLLQSLAIAAALEAKSTWPSVTADEVINQVGIHRSLCAEGVSSGIEVEFERLASADKKLLRSYNAHRLQLLDDLTSVVSASHNLSQSRASAPYLPSTSLLHSVHSAKLNGLNKYDPASQVLNKAQVVPSVFMGNWNHHDLRCHLREDEGCSSFNAIAGMVDIKFDRNGPLEQHEIPCCTSNQYEGSGEVVAVKRPQERSCWLWNRLGCSLELMLAASSSFQVEDLTRHGGSLHHHEAGPHLTQLLPMNALCEVPLRLIMSTSSALNRMQADGNESDALIDDTCCILCRTQPLLGRYVTPLYIVAAALDDDAAVSSLSTSAGAKLSSRFQDPPSWCMAATSSVRTAGGGIEFGMKPGLSSTIMSTEKVKRVNSARRCCLFFRPALNFLRPFLCGSVSASWQGPLKLITGFDSLTSSPLKGASSASSQSPEHTKQVSGHTKQVFPLTSAVGYQGDPLTRRSGDEVGGVLSEAGPSLISVVFEKESALPPPISQTCFKKCNRKDACLNTAPHCFTLRSNVELVNSTSLPISIVRIDSVSTIANNEPGGGGCSGDHTAAGGAAAAAGLWRYSGCSSGSGLRNSACSETVEAVQMLTPTASTSSGFFSTNSKRHHYKSLLHLGPGERGWLPLSLFIPTASTGSSVSHEAPPLCAVQVHASGSAQYPSLHGSMEQLTTIESASSSCLSQPLQLLHLLRQRAALAANLGAMASKGSVQPLLSCTKEGLQSSPSVDLGGEVTHNNNAVMEEADYCNEYKDCHGCYTSTPAAHHDKVLTAAPRRVFMLLSVEPHEIESDYGWELRLRPPMIITNALPVPVSATLLTVAQVPEPSDSPYSDSSGNTIIREISLVLPALSQPIPVYGCSAQSLLGVQVRPTGLQQSAPLDLKTLLNEAEAEHMKHLCSDAPSGSLSLPNSWLINSGGGPASKHVVPKRSLFGWSSRYEEAVQVRGAPGSGLAAILVHSAVRVEASSQLLQVPPHGLVSPGASSSAARVPSHVLSTNLKHDLGQVELALYCKLWVYNCTGVPLALQPLLPEGSSAPALGSLPLPPPTRWLPPCLKMDGQQMAEGAASSAWRPALHKRSTLYPWQTRAGAEASTLRSASASMSGNCTNSSDQRDSKRRANLIVSNLAGSYTAAASGRTSAGLGMIAESVMAARGASSSNPNSVTTPPGKAPSISSAATAAARAAAKRNKASVAKIGSGRQYKARRQSSTASVVPGGNDRLLGSRRVTGGTNSEWSGGSSAAASAALGLPLHCTSLPPCLCGDVWQAGMMCADDDVLPLQLGVMNADGKAGPPSGYFQLCASPHAASSLSIALSGLSCDPSTALPSPPWSAPLCLEVGAAPITVLLPFPMPPGDIWPSHLCGSGHETTPARRRSQQSLQDEEENGDVQPPQASPGPALFVAVRLVKWRRGSGRCLALYVGPWHIMPRFVIHNALQVPLQLQQTDGQGLIRTPEEADERWTPLAPHQSRPLHWPCVHPSKSRTKHTAPAMKFLRSSHGSFSSAAEVALTDGALMFNVRVSQPGWSWSGCIDLGGSVKPGEFLIKVRQRNQQETLLLRVDVHTSRSGLVLVKLSHQASAFSPFRIDNCTTQRLHIRQVGVIGVDEDVIRPFSSLPYTWDEPSTQKPRLCVDLSGGRRLGHYTLQDVGLQEWLEAPTGGSGTLRVRKLHSNQQRGFLSRAAAALATMLPPHHTSPALAALDGLSHVGDSSINPVQTPFSYVPKKDTLLLIVAVEADGPTRVLKVIDANRHVLIPSLGTAATYSVESAAKELMHGQILSAGGVRVISEDVQCPGLRRKGGSEKVCSGPMAAGQVKRCLTVSLNLSAVGLSLVSKTEEVAYLNVQGLKVGVNINDVEAQCELQLGGIQLDNCLRGAEFPVTIFSPAERNLFGNAVIPQEEKIVRHEDGYQDSSATLNPDSLKALALNVSLWRSLRGGGVLCVREVNLDVAPIALYLEEVALRRLASTAEQMRTASFGDTALMHSLPYGSRVSHISHMLEAASKQVAPSEILLTSAPDIRRLATLQSPSSTCASSKMISTEQSASSSKIYIQSALVSALNLSLSFMPAPWHLLLDEPHTPQSTSSSNNAYSPILYTLQHNSGSWRASRQHYSYTTTAAAAAAAPTGCVHAGSSSSSAGSGAGTDGGGMMRVLLSLAQLEGAWVQLKPLQLRHPLVTHEALGQVVAGHYLSSAFGELYKLIGALDLFGDAVRLVRGLGVGMWHLIALPAEGAVKGSPGVFFLGLMRGISSMTKNMCYGTSNSITKGCRRARATLLALCSRDVAAGITLSAQSSRKSMLAVSKRRSTAASSHAEKYHLSGNDMRCWRCSVVNPSHLEESGTGNNLRARVGMRMVKYHQKRRDLLEAFLAGYGAILSRISSRASELPVWALPRSVLEGCLQGLVLPVLILLEIAESSALSFRSVFSSRAPLERFRVPRIQ
ncbi:hypothetical protein CEUSTIGMA_g5319.t1 [Chlamydomonas eustigma]|uniref:Vacuolar protein sorting-associated protein 13 VPS13 adaptor binding domain-containing protein n=1 Tax=Chlamydomonas eustigma TaxID=1157962 RepID=A0A250X470_9CHLO|nr:hypothetical protein CEUSTIGMA_g5319.t1 [Chlamydomonas eustigma]|eukprot:GAX77877.1 hypothetical protein CEUSTIGMA_g5319.t1 [Chlamydomonas eustigma]